MIESMPWKTHIIEDITPEENKRRRKRFGEVFAPILLENGFIQKGEAFFRLYGEDIFQYIELRNTFPYGSPGAKEIDCFATYLYGKYIDVLADEYAGGGYKSHLKKACSWKLNRAQILIEKFCGIEFPDTYRAGYLERIWDYEEGLQKTYEVLIGKAIPQLNRITEPSDLISKGQAIQKAHPNLGDMDHLWWNAKDQFVYMLQKRDWEGAMISARSISEDMGKSMERQRMMNEERVNSGALLRDIKSWNKKNWQAEYEEVKAGFELGMLYDQKVCKFWENAIDNAGRKNDMWAGELINQVQQIAYEDLNRISPRILKSYSKCSH